MPRTDNALRTAPFFPRAAAWLLDRLILGIVLLGPRLALAVGTLGDRGLSRAVLFRFSWMDVILWALCAGYFVLLTALTGSTLGKKAMGLTVVTREGERPPFLTVLWRETFARYLSSILCIGYLLCLLDPENGALHDRICDTRVVYAPERPIRRPVAVPKATPALRPVTESDDWYAPNR